MSYSMSNAMPVGGPMMADDRSYPSRINMAQEMVELFNMRMLRQNQERGDFQAPTTEADTMSLKERELYYGCMETIRNYVMGELIIEEPKEEPQRPVLIMPREFFGFLNATPEDEPPSAESTPLQ